MKNMNEMTKEELVVAARRYDKMQNEGGGGYNPYWTAYYKIIGQD